MVGAAPSIADFAVFDLVSSKGQGRGNPKFQWCLQQVFRLDSLDLYQGFLITESPM